MRGFRTPLSMIVGLLLLGPALAFAQTFSSGSTGADGPFAPTSDVTLTLPPDGGFHFTTVTIPAGVTVRFTRNTANTPVTLLATGDVTIAGTLDVSGTAGGNQLGSSTNLASNAGLEGPAGSTGGPAPTASCPRRAARASVLAAAPAASRPGTLEVGASPPPAEPRRAVPPEASPTARQVCGR